MPRHVPIRYAYVRGRPPGNNKWSDEEVVHALNLGRGQPLANFYRQAVPAAALTTFRNDFFNPLLAHHGFNPDAIPRHAYRTLGKKTADDGGHYNRPHHKVIRNKAIVAINSRDPKFAHPENKQGWTRQDHYICFIVDLVTGFLIRGERWEDEDEDRAGDRGENTPEGRMAVMCEVAYHVVDKWVSNKIYAGVSWYTGGSGDLQHPNPNPAGNGGPPVRPLGYRPRGNGGGGSDSDDDDDDNDNGDGDDGGDRPAPMRRPAGRSAGNQDNEDEDEDDSDGERGQTSGSRSANDQDDENDGSHYQNNNDDRFRTPPPHRRTRSPSNGTSLHTPIELSSDDDAPDQNQRRRRRRSTDTPPPTLSERDQGKGRRQGGRRSGAGPANKKIKKEIKREGGGNQAVAGPSNPLTRRAPRQALVARAAIKREMP